MLAISGRHIEDRERAMAWRRVLDRTPALQAHELQNDALWEAAIREELGRRGRQRIEEQFSWQVCAEQMSAHYDRLLSSHADH